MNILNNISIKLKIILMLVAPVLGLLYFSINNLISTNKVAHEMEAVQQLSSMAVRASSLVHELQKERGYTAGFLGSNGKKFASDLPAQRGNTDQKISELNTYLKGFDAEEFGSEFSANFNKTLTLIDQLSGKRSAVSAFKITGKEAIGYYSNVNGNFIALIGEMVELSNSGEVTRLLAAYNNFLLGKERAGIERAVLAGTFSADKFAPGMAQKFSRLVAEQDTYANVFKAIANTESKEFFGKTMRGSAIEEVAKMRSIAFEKSAEGNFGIDPVYWFKNQTAKINLLKNVEDWLSENMSGKVVELQKSAEAERIFSVAIALISITLALLLALAIARNISSSLGKALSALNDISEGDGDLTQRLDVSGNDEIARLAGAFNIFVGKIEEMVSEIKRAAGSINTSASEISNGNVDLSQRTEEQASSLEETASSMEEMTSTVTQNADNAKEANQLVVSARDQADKGGSVVKEAINAMGEINESSKRIADIITVVEEIAFQTNLLALNAAVEAARAGEQGRGFAVVATEVRNLAGRSSDAAKEIKDLISDSVGKVKAGSELVDKSGQTLEEIMLGVKKVADIVAEISSASQEQASGIEQVNKAVMQMDDMTQQNAALVEEAAAASKSMEEQAGSLNELVSRFKVNERQSSILAVSQDQVVPSTERRSQERPFTSKPKSPVSKSSGQVIKKTGTDNDEWAEF